jgi:hypothetical protein
LIGPFTSNAMFDKEDFSLINRIEYPLRVESVAKELERLESESDKNSKLWFTNSVFFVSSSLALARHEKYEAMKFMGSNGVDRVDNSNIVDWDSNLMYIFDIFLFLSLY